MFSEIDSISTTIGEVEHKIDENGLKLTKGSDDLKEGFTDLKNAIGQMTFNTPNGVSSIPTNITAINQALDKILNTLQ
jgi:hypothetical protein